MKVNEQEGQTVERQNSWRAIGGQMKEKVSAKVVFKCGVVLGQVLIRSLKRSGP